MIIDEIIFVINISLEVGLSGFVELISYLYVNIKVGFMISLLCVI